MSDKRGIIKNIKPVFCRFDMDDEPERRAWQIIQQLSKGNGEGKNRSYNSIISEAVVGYYDKVTMSHEELLEKLEEVIHKEITAIPNIPVQMPYPYPAAQPQQTGQQQEQTAPKTEELNEAAHIKDKEGKADITVLDNRRLSKEITRKQAKGKSLTIRYRSGKTKNTRLSTEQYIRGPFGEKVSCICYAYLADALIRMRQDMFSGRGDFLPFVYQAENERSLSATVREIHTMREKTFEAATMEQFRRDWEEMQSLRMMDQYNYQRGRPDSERIKSFQQEIKQSGYQQVTEQMAAQAASFNLPVFSLTKRGTIAHVRDINALDKKAPVFMKKDWLVMLDILANKKEIPCSRNTLVCLKNAARDAYGKAEETDKPKLAGIAAKISCFLEAVDKKGLSGILRDDSILFSEKTGLPPFLSNTEKERFRHIYEAGAKEQMAVAERAAYYPGRER